MRMDFRWEELPWLPGHTLSVWEPTDCTSPAGLSVWASDEGCVSSLVLKQSRFFHPIPWEKAEFQPESKQIPESLVL